MNTTNLRTPILVTLMIGRLLMPMKVTLAQSQQSYTAAEAAKHVGENAVVIDRVEGVHRSKKGNVFLNMGGKYPNQAFTAFIPATSSSQFADAGSYDGKTISVSGKIELYRGKPEIVVTSISQIKTK